MSIEAMKQTFDFLHDLWEMKQTARSDRHKKVMWELDRAIGKAEKQEPVAWMYEDSTYYAEGQLLKSYGFNTIKKWAEFNAAKGTGVVPLYTSPQQADKQRPVAWWNGRRTAWFEFEVDRPLDECKIPLYTAPQQREWVGLTDEEITYEWELCRTSVPRYVGFARGIEAKLKEKNAYGWQSVENPTEYLDDLRGGDAT